MTKTWEQERDSAADKSFKKNQADYWEAHVQFGSDPELRTKWFHDVGFDAGVKWQHERTKGMVEAIKRHHEMWSENGTCLSECSKLCQALAAYEGSEKP